MENDCQKERQTKPCLSHHNFLYHRALRRKRGAGQSFFHSVLGFQIADGSQPGMMMA
jgi:hypothetical protein